MLADAPRWDQWDEEDDEEYFSSSGHGGGSGGGACAPSKCFAQAALTNALRVRSAIALKGARGQGVHNMQELRSKY